MWRVASVRARRIVTAYRVNENVCLMNLRECTGLTKMELFSDISCPPIVCSAMYEQETDRRYDGYVL